MNTNDTIREEELELDQDQIDRIDEIHNAVYELCQVLTQNEELEWDMSYIGDIADAACAILAQQGMRIRYPAVVYPQSGTAYIEEYYPA